MRHTIFALIVGLSTLHAETITVTLKDLGHTGPAVMRGIHPQVALEVPRYTGTHFKGGEALIYLRGSGDHLSDAIITVTTNQVPIVEVKGGALEEGAPLRVPLDAMEDEESATLEVAVKQAKASAWLVLENQTAFVLRVGSARSDLDRFFKEGNRQIYLAMAQVTRESVQAVMALAGGIGACYVPWGLEVALDDKGKKVVIDEGEASIAFEGEILRVNPEAVPLLVAHLKNLCRTGRWSSKKHGVTYSPIIEESVSLRGAGDLLIPIPVATAKFGGWPKDVEAVFHVNHGPLPEGVEAFLTVKSNGLLIKAFELGSGGGDDYYHVMLPREKLGLENWLEVAITTVEPSPGVIEATLHDDSYFASTGKVTGPVLNLTDFLMASTGVMKAVFDEEELIPTAKVIEILSRLRRGAGTVLWGGEEVADALLVVGSPSLLDRYGPPIDVERGVRVLHPVSEQALLRITKDFPVALLQLFQGVEDTPTLGVTDTLSEPFSWLKNFSADSVKQLEGDIIIGQGGSWFSLSTASKLHTLHPEQWDLSSWWSEGKASITGVLFLLALAFIIYVKINLTEQKELYEG